MSFSKITIFNLIALAIILALFIETSCGAFCPGHKVKCSESQTCCQAKTQGGYACCPYQNATCCADELHCCPQNTDCDSAHRRCIPRSKESEGQWSIIKAVTDESENEITDQDCPGSAQSCPDGYTCCQMVSGDYGCCPFNGAVCCADKIHCCPSGTRCDVQEGTCLR